MGTINGHARPIVGGAGVFADHTNVSCTGVPGRLWVCCGVPPAGPIICSGNGSTKSADCFSKPAALPAIGCNDTAGILYGITGVCHQSANRILFAANQLINNKCRGIKASMLLFGKYGIPTQMIKARMALKLKFKAIIILNKLIRKGWVIDWVTKINTCVNVQGDLQQCLPPAGGVQPPPISILTPSENAFIDAMLSLYKENTNWSEDDLYIEAIILMLTQGMGVNAQEEYRIPIMTFISNYLDGHASITADFIENNITTEQFVDSINGNVLGAQEAIVSVIGANQFETAMGESVGNFFNLVEPSIALETYGQEFSIIN